MEAKALVAQLAQAGITADPVTVVKNGIECTGIRVIDPESPNISAIVYYSSDETVEAIAARVAAISQLRAPSIDVEQVTDPAYISSHVYLTIQRCSNDREGTIKKDFLNLELVPRISLEFDGQHASTKINHNLLEQADISEDVLWTMARHNMAGQFRVFTLSEIMDFPEEFTPEVPFSIVSTDSRTNGATALAFPEVFRTFCEEHGLASCLILPSSIEELIVMPEGLEDFSIPALACMVNDINHDVVDELIQLDPVVYRYDPASDEVTIAAVFSEEGGVQ